MKLAQALAVIETAGGRLKYRGSKFGDSLRARLCQAALISMDGDDMVLTAWGKVVAANDKRKT
jgi:hypothetical protein